MTPEIVITVGIPGCGKSTYVKALLAKGYRRLNRDAIGGVLNSPTALIYGFLRDCYRAGDRQFILDNTYTRKEHREVLMQVAKELDLPVRVLWFQVPIEQAQVFAARRQVQRYGKVLSKTDYDEKPSCNDPNMFQPGVQYAFVKAMTDPSMDEGFSSIEEITVKTVWGAEYTKRALILDLDGTLRTTPDEKECPYPRDPSEVIILDGRRDLLQRRQAEGWLIFAVSNQSGVSRPPGDAKYVSDANVQASIEATEKGLGIKFDRVLYATERGGPPQTFLRKPMPGMGVLLIEQHKLDPAQCICVGDLKTDQTFAQRCGFQFAWAHDYFR